MRVNLCVCNTATGTQAVEHAAGGTAPKRPQNTLIRPSGVQQMQQHQKHPTNKQTEQSGMVQVQQPSKSFIRVSRMQQVRLVAACITVS